LLLVMSAGTTFENASRALLRLHGGLGRDGGVPGQVLRLEPLSQAETRELVEGQSPWCVDEAERDRLARRVHFETRGNPFLVTTMLRALQRAAVLREDMVSWPSPGVTIDAPLPIPAPSLARRTIVVRVMELDEASRQVLRAASIGALAVDADLIAVLTGLARERVEDLLAVLERHQLLAFHGEGYQFAAPLIAQAVREECLSPGERRTLCARAVVALASRADLESRLLRVELLVRIGPAGVAFAEALATARAALAESAPRAARRALAAAAAALEPGDEQGRSALDELRARVPA
jgi:hypothetical protein